TAPAGGRARARVSGGESATAASFVPFLLFRFPLLARFVPGAVDEELVGDLVAQGRVVAVAEGGEVVNAGGGGLGAGPGVGEAGLGVAVPADGGRGGGPGGLPPEAGPGPGRSGERRGGEEGRIGGVGDG